MCVKHATIVCDSCQSLPPVHDLENNSWHEGRFFLFFVLLKEIKQILKLCIKKKNEEEEECFLVKDKSRKII